MLLMFNDTKYEHPITYEHIEWMKTHYGVNLIHLNHGDVYQRIRRYGRFPHNQSRFCTNELKIRVGKMFYSNLADAQGAGFQVWYGMRTGESNARAKRYDEKNSQDLYHPHEILSSQYPKYLGKKGVRFRLPILDWNEEDVFEYLGDRVNPLYAKGFDRVGCFPCLASTDRQKERAFAFDEVGKQRRIECINIGHEIGKNVFTTKSGIERNKDSDPNNILDVEEQGIYNDDAPCFICNI